MSSQLKEINDENDLRVVLNTDTIYPINNDYWILVENCTIDYEFKFPLTSNGIENYETTLMFYNIFRYGLKFKNCTFNKNIQIYTNTHKTRELFFDNCTFEEIIHLRGFESILTFSNCTFKKEFKAQNSTIKGKVRFRESHFKDQANFRNTRFEGLADFWRTKFYQKTIFYKTDFVDTVVFSAAVFKENVLFTYTLIDKVIILRGTKAKKGFDISLAIINGRLGLFEFDLENYSDFHFIKGEEEYEKAVAEDARIPIKNKRETFRILKENLESQKNLSESLKFKAIEKDVLLKELEHKSNTFFEQVNLRLNWLSNNHGISYIRAFAFIIVVGWIFFYFSLLATEKFYFTTNIFSWEFSDGFKLFIEFLNPIHKFDYIENTKSSSAWFYLFDFLGKTFVGYGIYQFIQAFRKYK